MVSLVGFQRQLIHINMKHDHNAFENQIFHEYRMNERKVQRAIKFLQANGYKVYKEMKKS